MPADINAYALGLELQLQTDAAMDALSKFGSALKNIQKEMGGIAKSFSPQIAVAVQQEASVTQALSVAKTVLASKYQVVQDAAHSAMLQGLGMADAIEMQEKAIQKALPQIKKATELLDKLNESTVELTEKDKKLYKEVELQLKQFDDMQKDLEKLKTAYKTQQDFLQGLTNNMIGSATATNQFVSSIASAVKSFGAAGIAMVIYAQGLADVLAMQTAYAPSTMRAIGSQEALIRSTNKLRATLGVSAETGIETFKALAEAGFTAQQNIEAVAEANVMFAKSTGVSQLSVAEYQRRLELLTGTSEAARKALDAMSNMIVKTGLSAKSAESLIKELTESLDDLTVYYGIDKAEEFQRAMTAVAGAEQQVTGRTGILSKAMLDLQRAPLQAIKSYAMLGIAIDESASAGEQYMQFMRGLRDFEQANAGDPIVKKMLLDRAHLTTAAVVQAEKMLEAQEKLGLTDEEFLDRMMTGKGLVDNTADAWSDFITQLEIATGALKSIGSTLAEALGPILKNVAYIIAEVSKGIAWLIQQANAFKPTRIILQGVAVVFGVIFGLKMLMMIKSFGSTILGVAKGLKTMATSAAVAGKAMTENAAAMSGGPTAGAGIKAFLTNLAEGVKAFGNPQALFGVIVLGILGAIVGGTLIGVAAAMEKFNISAADIGAAAVGLILAAFAFKIMAGALLVLAPVAAETAPLLFPLALAFLAIGAAVTLAGLGIKLAAEGLSQLFKIVIDGGLQFVASIWALSLAFPILAFGLTALGFSLMFATPMILFGFGALLFAAGMAKIFNPILAETGESLDRITAAASLVKSGTGANLLRLAAGISGFMAALMGIAAVGAAGKVASFLSFGAVKSPITQANEIARAIRTIVEPASQLSEAIGKIAGIGNFMQPFIDSLLLHKEEIKESLKILKDTAVELEKIRKTVGEGQLSIPLVTTARPAEPVRSPITSDTARKQVEERQQIEMLRSTKDMRNLLSKIEGQVSDDADIRRLVTLLAEWLPKIAKKEDSAGLASAFSQWGG